MEPGEERTRFKLYAEAFRAWVPIVVSLCAISLTVFQAASTRRHARLSVQPRLGWSIDVSPDGTVRYGLVNEGLGPAIITSLALTVDGKEVGPDGPATCAAVDRLIGREGPVWDTHCFDMIEDYVLRAGDSVMVYASQLAAGATGVDAPLGPETYLRVRAKVRYCSFYEDCWTL